MVQVAKRGASVLKRRKSRNRMETATGTPSTPQQEIPIRSESEGDVVFYTEEPKASKILCVYNIKRKKKVIVFFF